MGLGQAIRYCKLFYNIGMFDDFAEFGRFSRKKSTQYGLKYLISEKSFFVYKKFSEIRKDFRDLKNSISQSYIKLKNNMIYEMLLIILERQLNYEDKIERLKTENHQLRRKLENISAAKLENIITRKNVEIENLKEKISKQSEQIYSKKDFNQVNNRIVSPTKTSTPFSKPIPPKSKPKQNLRMQVKRFTTKRSIKFNPKNIRKNIRFTRKNISLPYRNNPNFAHVPKKLPKRTFPQPIKPTNDIFSTFLKILQFISSSKVFFNILLVSKTVYVRIKRFYNCCYNIQFRIRKIVPKRKMGHVINLSIMRNKNFRDNDLLNFPNVEKLRIIQPNKNLFVGNGFMQLGHNNIKELMISKIDARDNIFQNLNKLEKLSVVWCHNINGSGFRCFTRLKEIYIDWSNTVDDSKFSFSGMKFLENINLIKCHKVNGLVFLKMKLLKEIRILNCVSFKQNIIDELKKNGTKVYFK